MDAPAPHKDVDVHKALLAVAERRLLRITQRTPYALRVREALVREASPHRADMDSVARSLGLSARSLRRRLANEDKSYGEVANEARAIVRQAPAARQTKDNPGDRVRDGLLGHEHLPSSLQELDGHDAARLSRDTLRRPGLKVTGGAPRPWRAAFLACYVEFRALPFALTEVARFIGARGTHSWRRRACE